MDIIRKLIPSELKQQVKTKVLSALTAEPEMASRIATRVIRVGVINYLTWDYAEEKARMLKYLERRRIGEFEYTFSDSCTKPTLYAFHLRLYAQRLAWRTGGDAIGCETALA